MEYLHIILDVIIVIFLILPIIQGFRHGFVKTVLRLGKFLISFVFSCLFCKKMGVWLRDKWIYQFVYGKLNGIVEQEVSSGATIESIAETLPEGLDETLSAFGVDLGAVAEELAVSSETAISDFTVQVSLYVANIASVVVGFALLFLGAMIVLTIVGAILNLIVTHLPIIKKINSWLGGLLGVFLGFSSAWGMSQIIVALLGFFAMVDYTDAVVLTFFHDVNPLGWLFRLVANSLHTITIL